MSLGEWLAAATTLWTVTSVTVAWLTGLLLGSGFGVVAHQLVGGVSVRAFTPARIAFLIGTTVAGGTAVVLTVFYLAQAADALATQDPGLPRIFSRWLLGLMFANAMGIGAYVSSRLLGRIGRP